MWYFAWLLGLPLAAIFAVMNAMWLELKEKGIHGRHGRHGRVNPGPVGPCRGPDRRRPPDAILRLRASSPAPASASRASVPGSGTGSPSGGKAPEAMLSYIANQLPIDEVVVSDPFGTVTEGKMRIGGG